MNSLSSATLRNMSDDKALDLYLAVDRTRHAAAKAKDAREWERMEALHKEAYFLYRQLEDFFVQELSEVTDPEVQCLIEQELSDVRREVACYLTTISARSELKRLLTGSQQSGDQWSMTLEKTN